MTWVFRIFDLLRGPILFEIVWRVAAQTRPLTPPEMAAGTAVLGPTSIRYDRVQIAEGRLLNIVFRLNKGRAFTTFHVVNLPRYGPHSSCNLGIVVHELVHVLQFERVGSIYIWQALRAQRTTGYRYGGWRQLAEDRSHGKCLRDFNREQQGEIARDYYREVVARRRSPEDSVRQAYEPFVGDLRRGEV